MKKFLFLTLFLLFIPAIIFAQEKKSAVYFYADWCPHCQKINELFKENGIYDKYDIQKMNFDVPENKVKLAEMFKERNYVGQSGIPTIFIDDKMLVGDAEIIDYFGLGKKSIFQKIAEFFKTNYSSENYFNGSLTMFVLLGAALADAANPCALAVLILLLATVISAKGKSYALLSGFMFSLAIFISYLMMGLGFYKALTILNIGKYLSLGAGILAIVIALANFKDVFWYGKVFIMEVPLSWRPKMKEIIKKATSPWSAFGIGFLVSLFLVPCASGPYVAILARLAERVDVTKTVTLLVFYNLFFVLPMIIVTLAMYFFNTRMSKMEEWRTNNLRLMHAIIGTIMLIVGIYLIYTRL